MSQRYAVRTNVPIEESRAEVEELLREYGAEEFVSGWAEGRAFLAFAMSGRQIRMPIPMPTKAEHKLTECGHARKPQQAEKCYEQALRARWRAVSLVVKAKLEACAVGISTIEREFLWDLTVATEDGRPMTVGDLIAPTLDRALATGIMPPLLQAPAAVEGEFVEP